MAVSSLTSPGLSTALENTTPSNRPTGVEGTFQRVLERYLGEASQLQAVADQSVMDMATGKTEDIHNVMLAVAKADLAFRTILEVRNRLTEAYQEITRLQV